MKNKNTELIFNILGTKNIRFVGGCVRNMLMGLEINDIDLATTLSPNIVINKLSAANIKTIPTGIDHGTVTAVINGVGYEITTLRRDIETDGRHAKIVYTDNWAIDAARRDFTINALYADLDGKIYDPTEMGINDIKNKTIRFIGDAEQRINEDALRILRFFRFLTYYGDYNNIDDKSLIACAKLAHRINNLSRERISKELFLILKHNNSATTLKLMAEHKILPNIILHNINTQRIELLIKIQKIQDLQPQNNILASRLFFINHHNDKLIINYKIMNIIKNISKNILDTKRIDTQKIIEFIYYFGKETAQSIIDINTALQNINQDEHKNLTLLINTTPIPIFPISGKDLLNKGFNQGQELGIKLKELENIWINSGFKLSQSDLLNKLSIC